jgi:hypothetical protein
VPGCAIDRDEIGPLRLQLAGAMNEAMAGLLDYL